VDNLFINNYTLDECTYHCVTYSVTAHRDDGRARPKHVVLQIEKIYHLYILLVYISNSTTMHGVEHIKIKYVLVKITWQALVNAVMNLRVS
jgi:hypothetical protein